VLTTTAICSRRYWIDTLTHDADEHFHLGATRRREPLPFDGLLRGEVLEPFRQRANACLGGGGDYAAGVVGQKRQIWAA
jgi:hypothetical protein